jgi:hypothetical protein
MLSHHEISTLLLVQRSPAEVKALGLDTAVLRHERLIEMELLMTGQRFPRLTSKGLEVLERLNVRVNATRVMIATEQVPDDRADLWAPVVAGVVRFKDARRTSDLSRDRREHSGSELGPACSRRRFGGENGSKLRIKTRRRSSKQVREQAVLCGRTRHCSGPHSSWEGVKADAFVISTSASCCDRPFRLLLCCRD